MFTKITKDLAQEKKKIVIEVKIMGIDFSII